MNDNQNFYMIYSTANDDPMYVDDFFNFDDMARYDSGISKINALLVVSLVKPFSKIDRFALKLLQRHVEKSSQIKVLEIILKGNIGRDFSSVKCGLDFLKNIARKEDAVLIRNRSSYGPITNNWYNIFLQQYLKFPNTGLVGCAISLKGHPTMVNSDDAIHVQSYCYFSYWQQLENMADDFPGIRSLDRISTIVDGEIELSSRIMRNGFCISCLKWPDIFFDLSTLNQPQNFDLAPSENEKKLPFRYKIHRKSFRRPRGLLLGSLWILTMRCLDLIQPYLKSQSLLENYLRLYEYD